MRKINKKEREVASLWANGNISQAETARRLKVSPQNAYIILARALRAIHYQDN